MDTYWVELNHAGIRLGTGFLLTHVHVLTANHCLQALPESQTELVVDFGPDGEIVGHVLKRLEEPDLALIILSDPPRTIRPPRTGRCADKDRWRVPSRPALTDPQLYGFVNGNMQYKCEGGAVIDALQLQSEVNLGSYAGYSGGPVECLDGEQRTLVGILLEEYPDRQEPERSTNMLIAATVDDIYGRFECFLPSNLTPESVRTNPQPVPPATGTVRSVLSDGDDIMRWVGSLAEYGFRPDEIAPLRLRVANSVIDRAIGRIES